MDMDLWGALIPHRKLDWMQLCKLRMTRVTSEFPDLFWIEAYTPLISARIHSDSWFLRIPVLCQEPLTSVSEPERCWLIFFSFTFLVHFWSMQFITLAHTWVTGPLTARKLKFRSFSLIEFRWKKSVVTSFLFVYLEARILTIEDDAYFGTVTGIFSGTTILK